MMEIASARMQRCKYCKIGYMRYIYICIEWIFDMDTCVRMQIYVFIIQLHRCVGVCTLYIVMRSSHRLYRCTLYI